MAFASRAFPQAKLNLKMNWDLDEDKKKDMNACMRELLGEKETRTKKKGTKTNLFLSVQIRPFLSEFIA